jgi:hypothetical protein
MVEAEVAAAMFARFPSLLSVALVVAGESGIAESPQKLDRARPAAN